MPRPQPQPGDICSARSPAQVLSHCIYCSLAQPGCLCSVGPALSPDTLSSGCQSLERLHWRCSLACSQPYFHRFPAAAPKLLGTCDSNTVPTFIVPFQQHPCILSGKFLLCQLPFPPNSDSSNPRRRQAKHLGSGGAGSDLKSRTNLHPCVCHGEPNATEGGGSIS